jgi:hypothetical protein
MVTTAFQRSSKEVHVVVDVEGVGPQDGFDIDVTPQCWGTKSDGVPPDAHLRQSEKRGMCEARHLARQRHTPGARSNRGNKSFPAHFENLDENFGGNLANGGEKTHAVGIIGLDFRTLYEKLVHILWNPHDLGVVLRKL